jgi:hypothetical protein
MIVIACGATLYPKACSGALYSNSCTLGAMTQKVAMIFTNIALERGSNTMVDA